MPVKILTVTELKQFLIDRAAADFGDDAKAAGDYYDAVITLGSRAHERGDGLALYENHDLRHPEIGALQIVSYGGPDSQLETRAGTYDISSLRSGHHEPFTHGKDALPTTLPDIGGRINWRYQLVAIVPSYGQQEAIAAEYSCAFCDAALVPTENGWADNDGQQTVFDHRHFVNNDTHKDELALAAALEQEGTDIVVALDVEVTGVDREAANKLVLSWIENGYEVWASSGGETGFADEELKFSTDAFDTGAKLGTVEVTS